MSQTACRESKDLFGSYFSPEYFFTYFVVSLNTIYGKIERQNMSFQSSLLRTQWEAGKFEQSLQTAPFVLYKVSTWTIYAPVTSLGILEGWKRKGGDLF